MDNAAYEMLAFELAAASDAPVEVARRILSALGIDGNIREAVIALGRAPTIMDLVVGYRLPASDVAGE